MNEVNEVSENTPAKTKKNHLWKPGQSGNPAGKPKGCKHKTTLAVQELLNGEAEKLTRAAIELALQGDTVALRLCLERILPAVKENPISFSLPEIKKASDLPVLTASILESVSAGELLPGEAEKVSKLIDNHRQALELADLEARITAIEKIQEKRS